MKKKFYRLLALALILSVMTGTTAYAKENRAAQIINSAVLAPEGSASEHLTNLLVQLFPQILTPDMTTYDQVKACYDWLIVNTEYGDSFSAPEDEGLQFATYGDCLAYMVIKNHVGDCIGYSIAFSKMLKAIGLDCRVQYGMTSKTDGSYTTHAWVVAVIDGQEYIFDPQIEDNIAKGKSIGYYRFCKTYAELPNKYLIDEAAAQYAYQQNIYDLYNRWLAGVTEQENYGWYVWW